MPIVPPGALAHLLISAVLITALAKPCLARDSEVDVQLHSGRRLSGLVDERSDHGALWLRTERKSSYLRRPVSWAQIASIHLDGEAITQGYALALATPAPPVVPRLRASLPNSPNVGDSHFLPTALTPCSLAIRAEVGNWDRDHAPDGLLLWLFPQNASGEVIPVTGQAEVECWGLERRNGRPGGELTLIGRWSQPVMPANFTANGAPLKLPYGSLNPIEQLEFNPQGLMRVRLSVPGYDTFEAQLEGIRLRPATPVQDWQRVSDLFPR
jgi:hypothetical protein